jgi:hypothetical protein
MTDSDFDGVGSIPAEEGIFLFVTACRFAVCLVLSYPMGTGGEVSGL